MDLLGLENIRSKCPVKLLTKTKEISEFVPIINNRGVHKHPPKFIFE